MGKKVIEWEGMCKNVMDVTDVTDVTCMAGPSHDSVKVKKDHKDCFMKAIFGPACHCYVIAKAREVDTSEIECKCQEAL